MSFDVLSVILFTVVEGHSVVEMLSEASTHSHLFASLQINPSGHS